MVAKFDEAFSDLVLRLVGHNPCQRTRGTERVPARINDSVEFSFLYTTRSSLDLAFKQFGPNAPKVS